MIFTLQDGSFFDPSHLLHEAMESGFPVRGASFNAVVNREKAPTRGQARYNRGRLRWPGIGQGPPEDVGPPDDTGPPTDRGRP